MASTIGTAILVHGAWACPADWRWVCELLEGAGVACDAVDLPSHRSGAATRRDDVAAVQAAVGRATGPVVVAGWSYGGAVLGDMDVNDTAVEHLLYVASVPEVVIDAASDREATAVLSASPLILFPTPDTAVLDDERWLTQGPGVDAFSSEVMDHFWTHRRRPVSLAAWGAPVEREAWRQVSTTVLLGRDDRLVPPARQKLATQLPVNTRVVEGDHYLLLTRPDVVAGQICALFNEP